VLSIAAAKLGFGPITAIDHDESAVEAARRNVDRNAVEVDVLLGDGLGGRLPSANVGFANIDLASVQALGAAVDVGTLVTAGYFHTRTPEPARYMHRERRIDGGWAADRFVRE
jgi:ribosomal protein L11 methyltransferase